MVPSQVHIEPADDDRHRGVRPHDHEEECPILKGEVVVDCEEDAKAGNGDADWEDCEEEAVAREVGKYGDKHGEAEGDGPWRNGVELG